MTHVVGAHAIPALSGQFAHDVFRYDGVAHHVRHGGAPSAPTALLLHGHTQTGDVWAPLANALVDDGHRVVVPDLRGCGRSSVPAHGYDKATLARDAAAIVAEFGGDGSVSVVAHDLGVMVAYPLAHDLGARLRRLVVMEATVPGLGAWSDLLADVGNTWHFGFHGAHAERILSGREREYLDRFWTDFAASPGAIPPATRDYYAQFYRRPDGVRGALSHFAALPRDASVNAGLARRRLDAPVLAMGGAHALGARVATHFRSLAASVTELVVDGAGHWLLDEQPEAVVGAVRRFLSASTGRRDTRRTTR